ncbi:putative N-acetyltransferase [Nymphaea thermarum]|nr:putative N-acetyltransferase [Nymphaea thermarum]
MGESKREAGMISLRPFQASDLDDLMVWSSDDRVTRWCGWDSFTSREEGRRCLDHMIAHPWNRAVCLDGRPIGCVTARLEHRGRAELGYVLAYDRWGKGFATQAVKMAVPLIFHEFPDRERIDALVDVENIGSRKVLEKVGFVKEGLLRKYVCHKGKMTDMFIFSILASEYNP